MTASGVYEWPSLYIRPNIRYSAGKGIRRKDKKNPTGRLSGESNLVSGRIRDKKGPKIRQAGFPVQSGIVIYPLALFESYTVCSLFSLLNYCIYRKKEEMLYSVFLVIPNICVLMANYLYCYV